MNMQETASVLKIIKLSYPTFYKDMARKDAEETLQLWSMMFAEDRAEVVTEAVKAMIATLKFPPTIADIKEKIALITKPESQSEFEAWNMVYKAICDANYNAGSYFDNFPEIIKKIVGSPGQLREWAQMDTDTVFSVIQSNFMRSYKAKIAHHKQIESFPESTKALMEGLQEKVKMIGG